MYPRLSWPGVVAAARLVAARYDTRVTLRQLYYVLGAEGVIPLTSPTYRHLSAHLAEARRRGDFPKDGLIDLGREIHVRPRYAGPSELLGVVPELYRADRTAGQPYALYVGVEKDTLRVQITDWLEGYGIPVLVVRGYGSQTYADQVAAHVADDGRPAVLLFVGDLDASGEDIERDWVARTHCWVEVNRLAVTTAQAAGLPAAAGKAGDPRWSAFASRHGLDPARPVQYEVEAINPTELRDLLIAAVDARTDLARLRRVLEHEEAERRRLTEFLSSWSDDSA